MTLTINIRSKIKMKRIMNFINDESGLETIEYAIVAGLIAAVAVIVYTTGWAGTLATRMTDASGVTLGK
jgi:Flp pilus assembly pilin Flp